MSSIVKANSNAKTDLTLQRFLNMTLGGGQWRTQKIFMGEFHSVVYGDHLYLVCVVCDVTIRRHIHVYKPTFGLSLLT